MSCIYTNTKGAAVLHMFGLWYFILTGIIIMATEFMIQTLNLPLWQWWPSINPLKENVKNPNTSHTLSHI
jgi:hypothetical protein